MEWLGLEQILWAVIQNTTHTANEDKSVLREGEARIERRLRVKEEQRFNDAMTALFGKHSRRVPKSPLDITRAELIHIVGLKNSGVPLNTAIQMHLRESTGKSGEDLDLIVGRVRKHLEKGENFVYYEAAGGDIKTPAGGYFTDEELKEKQKTVKEIISFLRTKGWSI